MKFPLLLFVFILACAQVPQKRTTSGSPAPDWKKLWVQNACHLYNFERQVKTYPGKLCIFLSDGSFISATDTSLKKFSPARELVWEIPGHYHHQLNLSPDNKRILALSSEIVLRKKVRERDDVLLVIDLNGKILNRMNAREYVLREGLELLNWEKPPELRVVNAEIETTHFNSFYEIADNAYASSVPYMKPGNYIINSVDLGIFILSNDLQNVLAHHLNFDHHHLHDVQVSPDGNFL
ncbi:MAG: hypothetical protein ACJ76H_09915, partial [Bacteriovoracaceae bacterium]